MVGHGMLWYGMVWYAHFLDLVAVLFDVAVAAGKVTSTKAVVFSPASNIAKPETPFERSPPPPASKWADFEKRRQNPV